MDFVFADSHSIDALSFRRLLILANSVAFVNRPSIALEDNYYTVGVHSNVTEVAPMFESTPIRISVETPPDSVFNSSFYKKYFESDLQNQEFIKIITEGVEKGFIHDLNFKETSDIKNEFSDFKNWIIANKEELHNLDYLSVQRPDEVFEISNKQEAIFAFKMLLSEESMRCTSVLQVCNNLSSSPLVYNPYLNRLLTQRITNNVYTGKNSISRTLGIKLIEGLIPDAALARISIEELLTFREDTKGYYDAWMTEVKKLEANLINEKFGFSDLEIQLFIDSTIEPELLKLKNEIKKIRDDRFKDVMKVIKNTAISLITGGTLSTIGLPAAVVGFILGHLKTPQLTDEIIDANVKLKQAKEMNNYTYLLKINELVQ
jgi:hypothetical protein